MAIVRTDGRGIWSDAQKRVKVTHMKMDYISEDKQYASFRVYFTKESWSVSKHGLIYTDDQFLREMRKLLVKKGFKGVRGFGYTEQGMQGNTYVSCCAGPLFVKNWTTKGRLELRL